MSLTTDSERSDHEPTLAGLSSPLYGTATFTSLSPPSVPAPLSDSGASSARLSYPSRSVTPSTTDDGPRLRRVAISPTTSSYDSRRYTDSDIYSDENDNSIDDSAEVEDVLSRVDDDDSQVSRGDNWSSGYSMSGISATSKSATGSYTTATTEPLNFERERRSLSTISERTESNSLNSGVGVGTSILQNLFSSTFSRPGSFISAAARSLYGAPASPLTPPSTVTVGPRSATPERTFKPVPPTGRRVGNLVASFESDLGSRPGSVPIGPRSPSPFSGSSRPTSPTKSAHTRSYTDGTYTHSRSYTEGSISVSGHSQSASLSSYLSPPPPTSALSRSTVGSSETERPRSPLSSVRNIVAAWKERSPERASAAASSASRSTVSQSVVSGPSYSSGSMSSLGLFGGGIFSLRRRAALTATSGASRSRGSAPSNTDDFGSTVGSNTDTRGFTRSGSVRSVGGSSIFDMSELGSFIRGSQEPLRVGSLWYLNVHAPPPFRWKRCRAILYPNTLLLTWLAPGGGRGVVTLDLMNCNEVRSVPSPSHVSARDDIGTIAARLQMDEQGSGAGDYDLVEMLCPFQLLYSDGVERLGAESARERVQWVGAIWEALDRSVSPPERSMTMSPTGSIRTIRSTTSSVMSSGSGSATTTYLPPLDTIPDLSDLDTTTFTRSLSRQGSFTSTSLSSYAMTRTRSSDDGAISGHGGLLHPLDARSIEIAPSRSSSLRRTSSLADLDAEFAGILRGTGITLDSDTGTRTRTGGGSSRFRARWTREPSEYGGASSTISPSESASAAGVTRRVRASTFYTLSEPTFTQLSTELSTSDATQIIPSSLSLRGPSSASLLGDSHDGPPTSEDSQRVRSPPSPSTPTRARSPDTLYTSTSGLSRASAVRRRTPRSARAYSRSASSKSTPTSGSTSDKENECTECEPSQWSSLQGSYTSTSYEYSEYTREPSEATTPLSPRQDRVRTQQPPKAESESDEDIFITPTASRTTTSYHSLPSAPGTPTPSSTSLPTTEFDTALKAPSTEYVTAEICPSEPPSTEYITAEICPSTPPATEYFTAECICQRPPPTVPEEISSLTPSLSLTSLSEEKVAEEEVASLYAPTIPSVIEEANIPLPESEGTLEEPLTPSSEPSELIPSVPTPTIIPPTPSSVTESSIETTKSPSSESSMPMPSSPSSPSIASSPSSPSSPSSVEYRSESSGTPKSRSLLIPSQSSPKSTSPSITDFESSFFAPSPSLQSVPIQEQGDFSFETSFMRPGVSEMLSEQSPSPFLHKGVALSGLSSTVTPTSTSAGTTSAISPTVTRTRSSPEASTPSSVPTSSSLSSTQVSTLTPSTALLAVPPGESPRRTTTPSSLTLSSYIEGSMAASSEPYTTVSSLTPSSAFEDESLFGRTVTVTRTPSSVSSVSTASMRSSIFAPTVYDDAVESPQTLPTLLSSRATTPRPATPRDVPLPSSPSLSIATATPSASISTPRTDAHTLTSVETTDDIEVPREEILTHDVNRLLRYLHDLDQIRGGETQDIKDHLKHIEDELRDLSDFLRKPAAEVKGRSVGSSAPISRTAPSEYLSPPALPTAPPAAIPQRPSATSGSTPPLPVPEPRGVPTPIPSLTPPPQLATSISYSPSTLSRSLSILESPHSEDLSLMSLRDYPAVPISPPGSPSSPSSLGSGWPSSSTDAPFPPSSVTPSSVTRTSMIRGVEDVSDLTAESPFVGTTPMPIPSPLASLASAESALPMPPQSTTPSQEAHVSPMAVGPYARSPLPTPSPLEPSSARSSLSIATLPPSSSMPSSIPSSMPSSSPPSIIREGPSIGEIRQPASPVLSISEAEPPSPAPPASAVLSQTPAFPIPELVEPPELEMVPASPISVVTARPGSDRDGASRAIDDLRDLLEDLRGQAQALWNGQLNTNRMLEDLERRPTAPVPEVDSEELGNRLRNIEGLLDGILRDLERGLAPEEPPSEISSDTSSALRRYIDRLRDRRQEAPGLQIPTPVRAPPPALDPEWLEFLSEPPPVAEQPIYGPPPLVPLYRRVPRRHRELSTSPPVSIDVPRRPTSVPPFSPSLPLHDMQRPWRFPRVPRRLLRPDSFYDRERPISDFQDWPRRQPPRPLSPRVGRRTPAESVGDIDMLDQIHRLRQRRRGGDGRVDVTVPPRRPARVPSLESVPSIHRPHTAPPGEHVGGPWVQVPAHGRPLQTLGDAGTVPTPAAPPPQPMPGVPPGAQPMMPTFIPTGPRPPYEEMLHLLRQNRLAQTASIDQQREIMRYMRALNQWLENDVRDRHNEMQSIATRVDGLREALRHLGMPGVPGPGIPMPPGVPGQPQGQPGQTFIVPPIPQPFIPGMPGGPPVIPTGPFPGVPLTPGAGPGVRPPIPGHTPPSIFIPPPFGGPEPPVVPEFEYPRPGGPRPRPYEEYQDDGRRSPPPFVPPRPTPSPHMIPVPPPLGVQGPGVTVIPPLSIRRSSPSSSRTPSSSPPRSPRREPTSIHVHVPSQQGTVQPPPPEVHRMDEGRQAEMPSGPRHPDVPYSGPPTAPQPTFVVAPPQVPPTLPSAYPGPGERPPPSIVIHTERSPSPRDERHIIVAPSRGSSPTRVIVRPPSTRRGQRERTPSPHARYPRAESERDRPSRRRRSSPSPPHRRSYYEEPDRGRRPSRSPSSPRVIRVETQPSGQAPIVLPPGQPQPMIISAPRPESRRSRTRSRTPPMIIHEPQPPVMVGGPGYPQQAAPPFVIAPPPQEPSHVPVVVPPPPSQPYYEEGRRPYTASPPPTHLPSMAPTPVVVQVPSHVERRPSRSRSPRRSYSPRDEGRRLRRPSRRRSRSYSPRRDDHDRPRRERSPTYSEAARDEGRRLRRPSRRRSRSYSPRRDDRDRPRRERSPIYSEADQPDRPHRRRPSYERSPSRYSPRAVTAVPLSRSRRPSLESDYARRVSPTRVVVRPRARTPSLEAIRHEVPPPGVPSYEHPEAAYEPPTQVITVPTGRPISPRMERPPTLVPVPPSGRQPSHEYAEEPPIAVQPSYHPSMEGAQPIPPPTLGAAIRSAIRSAKSDTEPVIPVVPGPPGRVPTHRIPSEPRYMHDEGVPEVVRSRPPRRSPDIYEPRSPSGPGDLALQEALERLDEQERRLEELSRAAADAEERREQDFREHEEERDRFFRENKERRFRELDEAREQYEHLREEVEHIREDLGHTLQEIPRPAEQLPVSVGVPTVEGVEATIPPSEPGHVTEGASITESIRPVRPPGPTITTEGLPQLQEILNLLRAQQEESAQCKAEQQERFDILRDEIDQARADAKAECEERIRLLEDELALAREELEREREQRRAEELERIEREHADVIERDEAMRAQLGDITNIVQEQREELVRKRELMDERWTEKQQRREDKQGRTNAMYEMLERILQEHDQERREREMERAAAAERPNIETVLEELRRQNEQQIGAINRMIEEWRTDSAQRHSETIDAVRATAQEMVPYNLTGYLDEFSKALAGEIRTLLGEVGRLHEQKRTLQFEIGNLLHMYAEYGPGGQWEPDWVPTMGPLAPPHIIGGGGEPPPGGPGGPGAPPPPPGPEEPPPPARPAWRTVQQRAPRRRRTKGEAQQPQQQPPASMLAPPEPIPHPPSWSMWQPNPAFVPTPPPPGASPLVVPPPSGPTGLFGPRSPRGTMYAG